MKFPSQRLMFFFHNFDPLYLLPPSSGPSCATQPRQQMLFCCSLSTIHNRCGINRIAATLRTVTLIHLTHQRFLMVEFIEVVSKSVFIAKLTTPPPGGAARDS